MSKKCPHCGAQYTEAALQMFETTVKAGFKINLTCGICGMATVIDDISTKVGTGLPHLGELEDVPRDVAYTGDTPAGDKKFSAPQYGLQLIGISAFITIPVAFFLTYFQKVDMPLGEFFHALEFAYLEEEVSKAFFPTFINTLLLLFPAILIIVGTGLFAWNRYSEYGR